ncbi:MAG: HEAT repeat domain-containing protein [Deltaproteobacteria bacterium]|nr:MAG: HEAT repeat domain-containing protein [Deltaproteobacteria bacterium]
MSQIETLLNALLKDEVEEVRDEASRALNRYEARKKFSSFLGTLSSGSVEERMRVVYAAEEIGGDEGMKLLLKALDDPSEEVRGAAARILKEYPLPEVLKAIAGRIQREKGIVLANMLAVLGNSKRKEVVPILVRFVDNPDVDVQVNALEALAKTGSPEALPKVAPLASSPNATVRKMVALYLGSISSGDGA